MTTPTALLSDAVRAFLGGLHVATVATLNADGAPHQAVTWFRLEPDGHILINGRFPRRWCTNLVRDRRVALSVIDGQDPYHWVGITGSVDEVIEDVGRAREDIVALAHRYHPEGPDPASIADFRTQPRVTFLVRVAAVHEHLED